LTQFVIPAKAGIQFLDYYNDLDPSPWKRGSGRGWHKIPWPLGRGVSFKYWKFVL